MNPLVSVITPTWQRHDLLLKRCIPSVQAQTYPEIEHVIISDGGDPELALKVAALYPALHVPPIHFHQLDNDLRGGQWGVMPRLHGLELATGDLIAYLDDDDAYRPNHVELLVQALAEDPEAGFAYSQMCSHNAQGEASVIGSPALGPCGIGTPMMTGSSLRWIRLSKTMGSVGNR